MEQVAADDHARPVLAQDLRKLRVPGKVAVALWTVRSDRCTLQVVMPRPGYGGRAIATAQKAPPAGSRPKFDLWLVGPNGVTIAPHSRWDSPNPKGVGLTTRGEPAEVNFGFPREAARLAIAAVLVVDGEQYVESINRLDD